MAENKYIKKTEEKADEKEAITPVVTNAKLKKKGVGTKFKEFLFSGDAREVKKDIIENTIKPAIIDGIYDVITGFIGGMLYDEPRRRRRRSGGNSYEKSSYTNYYKTQMMLFVIFLIVQPLGIGDVSQCLFLINHLSLVIIEDV